MSGQFATYPSLKDRVVFVTGGASGIGADVVRALHGNGAKVAFADIADAAGQALREECQGSVFFSCNLIDIAALQKAIAGAAKRLGDIGVLVNNAANDDRKPIDEIDVDYWDWSQNVNVRHQFFAAQAVRPMMRKLGGGSIINFSSIAWRFGADAMSAYATGKSAVIGLTKALARGFGADNIRVNAIEPGAVMTERQRKVWYPTQEDVDRMMERQIIRRILTGDEIARTVLFLAADDSRMITKQTFIVDAGLA